ncbi:MAG: cytochrome c maturation protein CcmE [Coriobacteriia bacterium]|nr:cytochrome c maturation protein CcmE [Coriobacteriia bacterium]
MNKRARNRLIGISVIIVLGVIALFATLSANTSSYNMTVAEAAQAENVGKRVKVSGIVVNGSWDRRTNPMRFEIRDEDDTDGTGAVITVVYAGATVPSTFGDGVTAIVTGEMEDDATIRSSEMITKCPSKYESATDAYKVLQLKERADAMIGVPVRVAGFVKDGKVNPPGSAVRFILVDEQGSPAELNVTFEDALPDEVESTDTKLVLTGEMNSNGAFDAVSVALDRN